MRARGLLVTGLLVVTTGSACDWREFDSLQSATPVLAVEAPSGYPSGGDFAQLLAATSPPADGSAAARFVTSGLLQTAVTVVTLSPAGAPSGHLVSSPALDSLGGLPITSVAAIPGTDRALLAAASASGSTVLTLDMAAVPPAAGALPGISAAVAAEPYLGMGLAAGNVTGSSSPNLVVASAQALHLYVGGGPTELTAPTSTQCPLALPANLATRDRIQRAVLVAPLTGGAPVIAVGTPGLGVPGTISFFAADKTAGTLTCLFSLVAPAGEPEFGRSLAVGRFHQGGLDLLVGAPPAHAYIYQAPVTAATTRITLTEGAATAGYFGAAAASLTGASQLLDTPLVSDPAATANAQAGAGVVFAFGDLAVAATPSSTLSDRSAGANDAYGSSVAALPFCAAAPCATPTLLPLVGAAHKAFVYFTLFATADPRLK